MGAEEVPDVRLVGTFEFSQLVRRAELPATTKLVALVYASYGGAEGRRIWPGEERVAAECGVDGRTVRRHLTALRGMGMLTRVRGHSPGRADEYCLSWPIDPAAVPMRLDPDGNWIMRPERPHRIPRSGVGASHRTPVSGLEPVDNRATPDTIVSGDALSPDTGRHSNRTPVTAKPDTAMSGQLTELPRSEPNTSDSPQATTSRAVENGHLTNQIDPSLRPPSTPTPEAYAEARDTLIKLPDFGAAFMQIAEKQYAAEGWRSLPSQIIAIRASRLARGTP